MRYAGTMDSKTEHFNLSKPRLVASHDATFVMMDFNLQTCSES